MNQTQRGRYSILIKSFSLALCLAAPNSDANNVSIFELSLEELLNVRIASQRPQPVLNSPAIVSSINADEMRSMGLRTLSDILSFLPGIEINENGFGNSRVQIRGLSDSFNQKVLFMLDGVPYWMPSNGDIPLFGIPIESITKVEVIRGPGSVLYGTNASAGVINIITKQGNKQSVASITLGTQQKKKFTLYDAHKSNKFNYNIGLESFREDGYSAATDNGNELFDFNCMCFSNNLSGSFRRILEFDRGLINLSYDDFNLTLQGHQKTNSRAPSDSTINTGKTTEQGYLIASHYTLDTGNIKYRVYADWNRYFQRINEQDINALYGLDGDGEISFSNNGKNNIRQRLGAQADIQLNNNYTWLSGAVFEQRSVEDYRYIRYDNAEILTQFGFIVEQDGTILLDKQDAAIEKAIFSQFSFNFDELNGYIGGRYVNNTSFGTRFNPSASLVYQFKPEQSIKLLYAEGFNSPTFRQLSDVDFQGAQTTTDVSPELIKSTDLAYTYSTKSQHLVANIYHIDADELIVFKSGVFKNEGSVSRTGIELDGQLRLNNWALLASLGYLKEGNLKHRDAFSAFSSKWLARMGASYMLNKHRLGGSILYGSKRGDVKSYTTLNLHHRYSWSNISVAITLSHSIGSPQSYPDVGSASQFKFTGRPANIAELTLSYKF